jgi:hypothetical protein
VIEPVGLLLYAYPTFIIPKIDGRVRCWVSDFCKLNTMLVHSTHPLLRIQDILTCPSGYKSFTSKINILMQY